MDDENIAHAVVAADDPDVAVVRIKDEIAGQRVCPCNVGAVTMLRGCATAASGQICTARGVIKRPVYKAGAIQSERQHLAGRAAAGGSDRRRRSPAAVPAENKTLDSDR